MFLTLSLRRKETALDEKTVKNKVPGMELALASQRMSSWRCRRAVIRTPIGVEKNCHNISTSRLCVLSSH